MRYGEAMLDSSDFVKKIATRNVVEKVRFWRMFDQLAELILAGKEAIQRLWTVSSQNQDTSSRTRQIFDNEEKRVQEDNVNADFWRSA